MHKRMSRRGAILLVIGIVAAVAWDAEAAVALNNGSFAVGTGGDPDGWSENTLDKASRQSWGSHNGDGWLMALLGWNEGSGTYGEFYQDVSNVVPGNVYSLSFWQDGDASWNGSNVTARLIWLDSGSNAIGSVTTNLDAYTTASWAYLTLAGIAPRRAAALRVQFDAQTRATGGGGAAKFDDLTLIEWPGLYNPGFTNGVSLDADNWTEVPSTEQAGRQGWGSHDGDGYLMSLPGYSSGTYGAFYQDIPDILPWYRYTLSFWQEGDNNWNGSNVTARLIWLDSGSNAIKTVTKNLDAYTAGSVSWTNLTLSGVTPAQAVTLRIQFDAESPASGGGAAKFDDFRLTRAFAGGTITRLL